MVELLLSIESYTLLINIAALLIYQFVCPKRTAFGFVLFCICALNIFHVFYQHELTKLYGKEEYTQLVRYLWYFGYAFSDFILVYFCIKYCEKKSLIKDKATNFILISYLLLGANQILRYTDRYIIESNLLAKFYQIAVPTLDISISIVSITFVSSFLLVRVHQKITSK